MSVDQGIALRSELLRRGRPQEPGPASPAAANAVATLAGMGLAATVLLTLASESVSGLGARGEAVIALGRLAGMVAAYAMLVLVLVVARLPVIERAVGQERLVAWHRRLGPWPLYLVAAHGVLITTGYALQSHALLPAQLWTLLSTYPGVLAGTAAFALLVAAGASSYRRVRRKVAYETWWTVHLYTYLALFLAFSHQVSTGAAFVGHPVARTIWTGMWLGGAALVLTCRVGIPLVRSLRHQLVVESVEREGPGVVSVTVRGRALDRLPVSGGQFLHWRVLRRGLWWQAHPYSLSDLPRDGRLRLTIKDQGDYGRAVARLAPGTRLAVEGPYGTFTKHARKGDGVVLVAAGVGVAPVRALLEDLPPETDVDLIVRASSERHLVLRDELHRLAGRRGVRLHELVGPREEVALDRDVMLALVPDVAERDVFVCGPDGFTARTIAAARDAGAALERVHHERFAF
jgi:predicted ferric reductase